MSNSIEHTHACTAEDCNELWLCSNPECRSLSRFHECPKCYARATKWFHKEIYSTHVPEHFEQAGREKAFKKVEMLMAMNRNKNSGNRGSARRYSEYRAAQWPKGNGK